MKLYTIDPLTDERWAAFTSRDSRTSVFHRREWLTALSRTYGYQPFVLTSAAPGEPLKDGVALCSVSSWITGRRLVSIPFADHCEPIFSEDFGPNELSEWCQHECGQNNWKYVEIRPEGESVTNGAIFKEAERYWLHRLDLTPTLEMLRKRLHKDSFDRRIRRAEKAGLTYEVGRSSELIEAFYSLLVETRRRHRFVPQPDAWFRNLCEVFGESLEIRVARLEGKPVAAILTLRHGSKVYYKYGCSSRKFHNLGAMPFLFWNLIVEAKAAGATEIDFGRTDLDHHGLITFKDHAGSEKTPLQYIRHSRSGFAPRLGVFLLAAFIVRYIFSILPYSLLPILGRFLYRHIGCNLEEVITYYSYAML